MSEVRWTKLSDVQSQPVKWLWEGRIPCGKVTLLDGEPGSGKSLLALDLAARVSRGAAMPLHGGTPSGPADVILFNDDDSLADTVRPRLEAAGADLTRITSVDGPICNEDLAGLRPALIVVDPLSVYFCLGQDVRPRVTLKALTTLARDTGAAVLAVQCMPKEEAWGHDVFDAARSVLFVSNIGHGKHRVALTKSNLRGTGESPPFVYNIEHAGPSVRIANWADTL